MPENILVDTKIMFLSQLGDKLWRKTEKLIIFAGFFFTKKFFGAKFSKTEKKILISQKL